jgi:methylthioribose-1-phosphate isomerase
VAGAEATLERFREAGRTLLSLGLVRGTEGNLSTFDGATLVITRTGSSLGELGGDDLIVGPLDGDLPGASSDLEVHRRTYRARGPGAFAHAHPAGTVPEDGGGPGAHGVYEFGPTLEAAVNAAVEDVRRRLEPSVRPFEWRGDALVLLDQTLLPAEERYLEARDPEAVADAIARLAVRGAPLLGIAAGFGVTLAAPRAATPGELLDAMRRAGDLLVASRPTAVNVAWAVRRVMACAEAAAGGVDAVGAADGVDATSAAGGVEAVRAAAVAEALAIAEEDERACRAIGDLGSELVPASARVLTHCNTGALATGGIGTALGVVVAAHRAGRVERVWVGETRPVLQGARLTAWELQRLGVPMTLVADAAAAALMAQGKVDLVVVGADRIAANGDVANKVGTYALAVLARHHGVPFYVAAPVSTIDLSTASGTAIAIERRDPREVTEPMGVLVAPAGVEALNPAFDVTPAGLVTALVTERGVARPPTRASLRRLVSAASGEDDGS